MNYLKNFFVNFLIIFFVSYLFPGLAFREQSRLPHVEGDLMFPLGLAFLNTLIYPILRILHQEGSYFKMGLIALVLNFASYALLKIAPLGIHVESLEGYLSASLAVSIGSFLISFFEMRRHKAPPMDPLP